MFYGKETITAYLLRQLELSSGHTPCLYVLFRKAHFEQHVVEWLADPKGSDALRECWIEHWTQVDEGLGSRLKVELAGRQVRQAWPPFGVLYTI